MRARRWYGVLRFGLDEAGYGPLLGPLVIGGAALRVPAREKDSALRARLRGIACRARGRLTQAPLPVSMDDSKEVHGRWGVPGLARGVCAATVASGRPAPTDLADLLERFGDRPPDAFAVDPWFAGPREARIPPWPAPDGFRERLASRGVEMLGVSVSPVTAAELNDACDAVDNKGRVLFLKTIALLSRMLDAHPGEEVEVVLDREGGRLDYEDDLASAFPFHPIRHEPSPRGESWYVLEQAGRPVRLRFATGADRIDLATGLASMAAKLTRELFMERLNAWFATRRPGLRPTAGYRGDGWRFLDDTQPVIESERIDRRRLVRIR
jgi:hypothetical protein